MTTSYKEQESARRVEQLRQQHRDWETRERREAARRAAEDRERTERAQALQQRQQEAEQARQRVWGERLKEYERQLAALTIGISTASSQALNALTSGDLEAAGDAEGRRLGLRIPARARRVRPSHPSALRLMAALAEHVASSGREPPDGDRLLDVVDIAVDKAALNENAGRVEQPVVPPTEPPLKMGQDLTEAE